MREPKVLLAVATTTTELSRSNLQFHLASSLTPPNQDQPPTPPKLIHGPVAEPRQPSVGRGQRRGRVEQQQLVALHGRGDAAVTEPVRGAEAARLEHVRAVPAEPPAAPEPGAVQRRARPRVPALPGPVRQDQGAHRGLPLLRPSEPARALPLPAPPGLGQPRRSRRPPPRRLRGEWRPPRVQSLRRARRPALPPRGPRASGPRPRRQLREEEAQEAAAAAGRQQRPSRTPAPAPAPTARRLVLSRRPGQPFYALLFGRYARLSIYILCTFAYACMCMVMGLCC